MWFICPSTAIFQRQNSFGHAQADSAVFCKLALIHGIVCFRIHPGKHSSPDLGQCLNQYWTGTKMLKISQELFFPFPFLASPSLPHGLVLCSVHAVLYTHLHFFFFPLPHLLFNLYCPAFFVSNILFYILPGSTSSFLRAVGSVPTSFLQSKGKALESFYELRPQPVTCTYTLRFPPTFSTGILKSSLQDPERKYILVPSRLPSSLLHFVHGFISPLY